MILVSGEALIDMLPVERDGVRLFLPAPGGSPYNVAMALGRLDAPVRFLCPLSSDPFGRLLAQTLRDSRVDLSLCPPTDALSTLGFVTLDPLDRSARYAFYTEGTAGCLLSREQLPLPLVSEVACVHVGSFSIAVEPFGSAIERLVEGAQGGCVVSVDPNIRPFLIRDRARYLARLERLLAVAHLVKLSREDLEWLHPGAAPESAAADYLARGARLFVVTQGADGAEAWSQGGHARVGAARVTVADTVGAGDTFQAAMLAWLSRERLLQPAALAGLDGNALGEMLGRASRAAAITCSRAGCNPPWAHEFWDLPNPSFSGN